MTLLLIISSLVLYALIISFVPKKYNKIFIILSIFAIFLFYFFLGKTFFHGKHFFPSSENYNFIPCGNFYNLLTDSILNHKLNIFDDIEIKNPQTIYKTYERLLVDTSFYKGKIYLYFGITPVLLFHLPFHIITKLYLYDIFLIFLLSCCSLLLSILLVNNISKQIIKNSNINPYINMLSIFFIGLCNLLPFIIIRGFIYQLAIITANVLLLGTFCLFYYFINTQNIKKQYVLIFFISFLLCLSVGTRPHYVLFIPVFFAFIAYLSYIETGKIKNTVNCILIFLIPCLIYGTVIALYNYFRFDSIFEFGWKYQLNPGNQLHYNADIKDLLVSIKNNFFLLPNMNEKTIFSLVKTHGHKIGNEYIVGIIWTCPIILMLFYTPSFLKKQFKINFKIFSLISIMLFTIIINIIVTGFIGMIIRYIFEYLSIMVILSLIFFNYLYSRIQNKLLKYYINFLFTIMVAYSIFINIALLFCKENFWLFPLLYNTICNKVVRFLF